MRMFESYRLTRSSPNSSSNAATRNAITPDSSHRTDALKLQKMSNLEAAIAAKARRASEPRAAAHWRREVDADANRYGESFRGANTSRSCRGDAAAATQT